MGMALGIRDHGRVGFRLAGVLAAALSPTRAAPASLGGGTGIHPQRSPGADEENQMGPAHPSSSDLGVCGRKIPDRPHLVVLSVLGTGFSATQAWSGADEDWAANHV